MRIRIKDWKWPALILAGAGFIWLKSYGFHPTVGGDENTYFYMARLMTEGKVFYRDFFYAHPPFNLLFLTLIYRLFGFNLVLLKLTASLPVLAAAAPLYLRFWKNRRGWSGVCFLAILLGNYELLKVTTHPFGVSLAASFLMLSLYFFLEDRPLACGLCWGLAAVTGLYALPWGVVPAGYYLFHRRRRPLLPKFLLGFGLVFGTVNGLCCLLFGERYYTPVYLYHLLKPKSPESVADIYIQTIRRNPLIFFLPFLLAWSPKPPRAGAVLAAALLYLVILAVLNPLFTQYFMLPIPFLAWIGAAALGGRPRIYPLRRRLAIGAVSLLLLLGFGADNIIRYIDRERVIGFDTEEQCRDFLLRHSHPDDLIFGHVTAAPLLALLTGRGIALDMVDTNHMRFRAGLADLGETMEKLRAEERLKFIVIIENRFWASPEVAAQLAWCRPAAYFDEPRGRIIFYDCRPDRKRGWHLP